MEKNRIYFKNAQIYTPHRRIENGGLLLEAGRIVEVGPDDEAGPESRAEAVLDMGGNIVIPGFIDVHVHGGGGFDVMSALDDENALDGMSRFHASKGTTSFLATTVSASQPALERAVEGIVRTMKRGTGGAEVVGIHLEGPFINAARCGAQNPANIRNGTMEEMRKYVELAEGRLRLMTVAPENEGAEEIIRYAVGEGVAISIGHTDADYETVRKAVQWGASHVTHLFNGMRPLHHREPGTAGAALISDELGVELICDGIHVHRELVSFVFRVKGRDKVILITDAISAAGRPDGEYVLGGLPVIVKDGTATLKHGGALAGSCLTMDQALRNAVRFTGLPLEQVLPALTINPAKQIGLDGTKGSIEPGKDGDFTVLNPRLEVLATYVKGRKVFG